jgi:hypothetical protein
MVMMAFWGSSALSVEAAGLAPLSVGVPETYAD